MSHSQTAFLLAGVLALAACGSHPVGLTAQAGSTIGIAITSEAFEGGNLGFGGLLGGTTVYDDQRGELVFVLETPGGGPEYTLETRVVTRAFPDPASDIGLQNEIEPGSPWGIAQPIALVDIPTTVPPGTYDIEVRRRRRTSPTTWQNLAGPLNQPRQLTVLPADVGGAAGSPTPFEGMLGGNTPVDTSSYIPSLYPHPKILLKFTGATLPSAAHLVVSYPAAKMSVLGVIEEQHYGRSSIVAHDVDPGLGQVTIDFADPAASVGALALVFDLTDPFGAGRVVVADFSLDAATRLYDADGNVLATSLGFGPIR